MLEIQMEEFNSFNDVAQRFLDELSKHKNFTVTMNFDFSGNDAVELKCEADEDNQENQKSLEQLITGSLREIGVPAHILGYGYLREAIMLCVEDKDMIYGITKTLYPTIANNNHTTSSRVERAIRHAIEISWLRGNQDYIDEIFGYSISSGKGKPTNSEFIALLSDRMVVG